MMIDRNLNYGRNIIEYFLKNECSYSSILDLGAGSGADLSIARKINPRAELYAVEVYPDSAQKLLKQNIRVLPINLETDSIPLSDEHLDVVMSNQVFEHVKELFWICHEMSRVLKVGGSCIIGVPNLAAFHNRLLLAAGLQPSPIKNWSAHVRGFTKSDLLNFFEKCYPDGYELIGFKGANFYPFPPILARPLATLFPNLAWGIFLKLKKIKPYRGEFLKYLETAQLETNFYKGPHQSSQNKIAQN